MKTDIMENKMDQSPWTKATHQSKLMLLVPLCMKEVKEKHLKPNNNENRHDRKPDGSATIEISNTSIQTNASCTSVHERGTGKAFETKQ